MIPPLNVPNSAYQRQVLPTLARMASTSANEENRIVDEQRPYRNLSGVAGQATRWAVPNNSCFPLVDERKI